MMQLLEFTLISSGFGSQIVAFVLKREFKVAAAIATCLVNIRVLRVIRLQVCWEKFTRYFDVEEKYVFLTQDNYVLTAEGALPLIDENTIGALFFLDFGGFPSLLSAKCIADHQAEEKDGSVVA